MSFWQPTSACGTPCLDSAATVSRLRRAGRMLALVAVVAIGAALLPALPPGRRAGGLRRIARAALRALGVRVDRRGTLPARRALVVANHVSWLDILVLAAIGQCRLVAKREIRDWPVIGSVAAGAGTVFIDRVRPKSLPGTVAAVRAALAQGAVVVGFPEGTTSCGRTVGPLRPALFEAAVATGAPVVPVRLRFSTGARGGPGTVAAFVGDETLLRSVLRVAGADRLRVTVRIGTAIHPDTGATRRVLARLAADALAVPAGSVPLAAPVGSVPLAAPVGSAPLAAPMDTARGSERTPTAAPTPVVHAPVTRTPVTRLPVVPAPVVPAPIVRVPAWTPRLRLVPDQPTPTPASAPASAPASTDSPADSPAAVLPGAVLPAAIGLPPAA